MKGWPLPCAANPTSMHEGEYVLTPAKDPKRVLVIGAGPGGMKAAITAAQRGFDVTLWEKSRRLGGAMAAAGAMDFKSDVRSQVDYLERQIAKYDIAVELGHEATIEDVRAYDPDFVVVATGADPIVIPVPGARGENVKLAIPVLLGDQTTGQRVAVIGGGDVGCELAVELCRQGKEVTIVEMVDKLMSRGGSFVANEQNLRYLVAHSGAHVICGTRLMEICDDGVIVQKDGEELRIPCDTVVFAAGYRANHSLYESILDAGYDCVQVGDNVRPGKISDAISQGYNYSRVLE